MTITNPLAPAPVDHQVAPPPPPPDRAIAAIGLVPHPTPKVIAQHLKAVAKILEDQGAKAETAAGFLAARGWPTATLGDGTGSRSTSTSSSVERAARADVDTQDPGHWDDIDRRLAKTLRLLWATGLDLQTMVTDLLSHADDIDELPAGHGECEVCGRFCVPAKDSNDRLRSGYCNACRMAWDRADRPARTDWAHERRHRMFDGRKGYCDRCKRPWTADVEVSA